jgi:hypothetical protein
MTKGIPVYQQDYVTKIITNNFYARHQLYIKNNNSLIMLLNSCALGLLDAYAITGRNQYWEDAKKIYQAKSYYFSVNQCEVANACFTLDRNKSIRIDEDIEVKALGFN